MSERELTGDPILDGRSLVIEFMEDAGVQDSAGARAFMDERDWDFDALVQEMTDCEYPLERVASYFGDRSHAIVEALQHFGLDEDEID